MSSVKLLKVKKYLNKNLSKKFITFSQTFYFFLILFILKANKDLWFCMNYWKLNVIFKRNKYSLSLINELTTRFICTWCWLRIFWFYVLNKSQKSQEISIQRNSNDVRMLHKQKSQSCRVFIYATAFSLTVTINLQRRLMTCRCQ